MFQRKSEGYRDLLVYQKAQALQEHTLVLTALFPKTKTYIDLADQMARSARSTTKNIVEGWKRNTTKEYFTFLGYSIGSNSEMMEDAGDIVTGLYRELTGIKGLMGERGGKKGEEKGEEKGHGTVGATITRGELDKLPFYPLNPHYSPIVKLFLGAKEVNFLLERLQKSLDVKMGEEKTLPRAERYQRAFVQAEREEKENDAFLENYMREHQLVRLPDGRVIEKFNSVP